ncbi:MAG: sterol desaturase family protein [Proteobacteria bacterium]|nr:sterol desaturase family protein [Pseudomonadota bacterium]
MTTDILRIIIFVTALLLLAAIEYRTPRIGGRTTGTTMRHYAGNGAYLLAGTALIYILFPLGLSGLAIAAHSQAAPLTQALRWLLPPNPPTTALLALETLAVIIIFDFAMWLQHMLFHRISWLWRLHRIHHSEAHLDVSTGFRFNPAEVLVSYLLKAAIVIALCPSVYALAIWLIVFNLWTLATHANIALPRPIERILGTILITPDAHRVHHLNQLNYQNSNYGSLLCIWDRLFRTRVIVHPPELNKTPVGLEEISPAQPQA